MKRITFFEGLGNPNVQLLYRIVKGTADTQLFGDELVNHGMILYNDKL
jgi:hypothetical protein